MKTLRDVARMAGVSHTTVSRYLNGRVNISDKTRQRIEDAMKALDYHPNELARGLSRRRSMSLGVILPNTTHPYFSRLANAIEVEAMRHSYRIMLCYASFPSDHEASFYTMLRRHTLDGIISVNRTPTGMEQFGEDITSYPIVFVDSTYSAGCPCVMPDIYNGGVLAAEHLIERGCKRLLHIAGDRNLPEAPAWRSTAFAKTCEERGVPYALAYTTEGEFAEQDYPNSVREALRLYPDVDGIFAFNDIVAAQCINALREAGVSVPEQVKVLGFDDIELAHLFYPSISTIHLPAQKVGQRCVQVILDMIDGKPPQPMELLEVELIARDSTRRS